MSVSFGPKTCFEVSFHSFKSRRFFKMVKADSHSFLQHVYNRATSGSWQGPGFSGLGVSEGFESVKGPEIMHSIVESYTGPSCTVAKMNYIASKFFDNSPIKCSTPCFAGIMDTIEHLELWNYGNFWGCSVSSSCTLIKDPLLQAFQGCFMFVQHPHGRTKIICTCTCQCICLMQKT